ncbi:hybrid sensor histidine kinase/response regulator transcription factor [Pseudoflavitalea rhizosphaerae]|uniref:hybrid sensor histidine kinase/response regulator transcription factor n=1 Tax=Pseudoflavitalea rhizosphaerae TaxID=1884793 RepID=UPI000F8DD0F3|nr:two-component regulator propeller domain-containing protein [Pseudoflavitalea rhizosphaerae]
MSFPNRILLVVQALLLISMQGICQQVNFSHLDVSDRLSQNSVIAITQDAKGFMWFGTRQGLNKYDSRKFTIYKNIPGNRSSISNNYIYCLLTDQNGQVWAGTQNGLNRYHSETDQFDLIPFEKNENAGSRDKEIICLFEDSRGRIWVGTRNTLYLITDVQEPVLVPVSRFTGNAFRLTNINCVYEDAGIIWVGSDHGLVQLHEQHGKFSIKEIFHQEAGETRLVDNQVKSIVRDSRNRLWIGTAHRGLHLYDPSSGTFRRYQNTNNRIASDHIRKLLLDKEGNLWIGTQEGLSKMQAGTELISTFINNPWNDASLSQNSVHSIYMDKTGSIWVGTFFGGVNCLYALNTPFTVYSTRSSKKLNNNVVSSIVKDNEGDLWIGTEGGGINRFGNDGSVTYYKHDSNDPYSPGSNLVKVLYKDKEGNIWAGTHGGGLNLFDRSRNRFIRYLYDAADPYLQGAEITNLMQDAAGRLWIGTETQGLQLYQKKGSQLEPLPAPEGFMKLQRQSILSTLITSNNTTWVGTRIGLYILTSDGSKLLKTDSSLFPVNCLYEDKQQRIWAGSGESGLVLFDKNGNRKSTITKNEGLPDNNVLGIIEGNNGELWISTINGLARYNPVTGSCNVYNTEDGLAGNVFNNNAWYKAPDGNLYFGGYFGLTAFKPGDISQNLQAPPVEFSSFNLHNKEAKAGASGDVLQKHISYSSGVKLKHNQNAFSVEFAVLNFIKPDKNRYAYKLEGFDGNFTYTSDPLASYTNVPPGNYTLIVKGSNNDGVWGEPIALKIKVLPPFWKTWWAYTLYILAGLALVFFVSRYFLMQALMKRNNTLTQLKLNFFTNISHEIRTHLSLITGPTEKLMSKTSSNTSDKQLLQTIRSNSDSLLQLVNELMDFRKAETGHLTLHTSTTDIAGFAQSVYNSFGDIASSRKIDQQFSATPDHINLTFDREQMEKVFYNLFSNAFKFTPDGGFVKLNILEDSKQVIITVSNSGKGIARENVDRLFDNYFQENDHGQQNTGYGIGLALSKSIVQAHKGAISVSSTKLNEQELHETIFRVTLLKGTQHYTPEQLVATADPLTTRVVLPGETNPVQGPLISNNGKPTILLVEDNKAIRTFIKETLQENYFIAESADGVSGLAYAVEHIPDLIISDVMMPEMDGLEFCSRIKSDIRTSHIPVVLLTAKTAVEHQISGLQTGANIYLTKPFSTKVLELTVQNLLQAREKYWQHFNKTLGRESLPGDVMKVDISDAPDIPVVVPVLHPLDEAFLKNIESIVFENMGDPGFGVGMLSQKALMSQPVLYKKIKAITGLSANDFVKSLRLKQAATLLSEQRYTVYEIAYMVGYEDSKYFSREFKKQYGVNPSEYGAKTSG